MRIIDGTISVAPHRKSSSQLSPYSIWRVYTKFIFKRQKGFNEEKRKFQIAFFHSGTYHAPGFQQDRGAAPFSVIDLTGGIADNVLPRACFFMLFSLNIGGFIAIFAVRRKLFTRIGKLVRLIFCCCCVGKTNKNKRKLIEIPPRCRKARTAAAIGRSTGHCSRKWHFRSRACSPPLSGCWTCSV